MNNGNHGPNLPAPHPNCCDHIKVIHFLIQAKIKNDAVSYRVKRLFIQKRLFSQKRLFIQKRNFTLAKVGNRFDYKINILGL